MQPMPEIDRILDRKNNRSYLNTMFLNGNLCTCYTNKYIKNKIYGIYKCPLGLIEISHISKMKLLGAILFSFSILKTYTKF